MIKLLYNKYYCMFQLKGEKKVYVYDADHERKRKEQLRRLFDRTEEQVNLNKFLLKVVS